MAGAHYATAHHLLRTGIDGLEVTVSNRSRSEASATIQVFKESDRLVDEIINLGP